MNTQENGGSYPKLKSVIIENEKNSRIVLQHFLREFCSEDIELVGTAECYETGLSIIRTTKPDVVFLDIELNYGYTGFDILHNLLPFERDFAIICTTDHTKYMLHAIKESVVDYLIKPIDIDDLMQAVEKAKINRAKETAYKRQQNTSFLLECIDSQYTNPKLVLKKDKVDTIVLLQDIIYCESDHKYTIFHTTDGEELRMRKNLGDYEEYLTRNTFLRINRSAIVNPYHIIQDSKTSCSTHEIMVSNHVVLCVTERYRDNLLKHLQPLK